MRGSTGLVKRNGTAPVLKTGDPLGRVGSSPTLSANGVCSVVVAFLPVKEAARVRISSFTQEEPIVLTEAQVAFNHSVLVQIQVGSQAIILMEECHPDKMAT